MALHIETVKEILKSGHLIPDDEIEKYAHQAKQINAPLEQMLVEEDVLEESVLINAIAHFLNVPSIDLRNYNVDKEALNKITKEVALEREVIAFKKSLGQLHVAMTNPQDLESIDFIQKRTGEEVVPYYTSPSSYKFGVVYYKKDIKQVFQEMISKNADKASTEVGDNIEDAAQKVSVVKLFDSIVEYAVVERASDIHIEPLEQEVLVRYRIDGILHDELFLPKTILPLLSARVKIISNLKIDEYRLPQDGRVKMTINNSSVSLRISLIPTFLGEKIVTRVLDDSQQRLSLEKLGFTKNNLAIIRDEITKPHGMILVTGPTGSGKTTTLYTILGIINTPEVNINTVEDPIEYAVARINQLQVNPKIGLTFAAGLRALLRQDPDVIMVGEIRDEETASIAVNAALTGHLVLSTLHTNDAPGAVPRLVDMGVAAFLLASSVNLIVAQRLVRKICQDCKVEHELTDKLKESLKSELVRSNFKADQVDEYLAKTKFFKGQGCDKCKNSGMKGRVGIYEVMPISRALRDLIATNPTSDDIRSAANKEGFVSLLGDGLDKASQGITTITEILRMAKE